MSHRKRREEKTPLVEVKGTFVSRQWLQAQVSVVMHLSWVQPRLGSALGLMTHAEPAVQLAHFNFNRARHSETPKSYI